MENKDLSEQMAEILSGLTDEQKEKAMACKTAGELAACLGELGVALPDELLDEVAGGDEQSEWIIKAMNYEWGPPTYNKYPTADGSCPFCGKPKTYMYRMETGFYQCAYCWFRFRIDGERRSDVKIGPQWDPNAGEF